MRERIRVTESGRSRLMDTDELKAYTNIGRNNAIKLGKECGAEV